MHRSSIGPCGCLLAMSTALAAQTSLYTFWGEGYDPRLHAVAAAGDVDRDGFDDVLAGAFFDSTLGFHAGAAFLFSGRDGRVLWSILGTGQQDNLGRAVAGLGDVDGDGVPDRVIGAPSPYGLGTATVYSGRDGRVLHVLRGTQMWGQFGGVVAGPGDTDGDGAGDVVVGAPAEEYQAGRVHVFSGRTGVKLWSAQGLRSFAGFGGAVAAAGDVDRDGIPDVIAGGAGESPGGGGEGAARVYSGREGRLILALNGTVGGSWFGSGVDGVGDVDQDGVPDLLVGAAGDARNGWEAGSVTLCSGRDGSVLRTILGTRFRGQLGYAVAGAGDLDRDGVPDLLAGAPYGAATEGSAWVFSGRDGSTLFSVVGGVGDYVGFRVSRGGDVNRDGVPDFLVGSYLRFNGTSRQGSVQVFTLASVAPVGLGCGAGPRPPALAGTQPRLGQTLVVTGTDATPGSAGYSAMSLVPDRPSVLGAGCAAYLDALSLVVVGLQVAGPAGSWRLALPVPADPSLEGQSFALQALFVPTAGPLGGDLTNGVYLRVLR